MVSVASSHSATHCVHANLQALYKDVLSLFAQLPLAAVVAGNTLILHGGLFRVPPTKKKDKQKQLPTGLKHMSDEEQQALATGSMADLRAVKKGSLDPDPYGKCSRVPYLCLLFVHKQCPVRV